MFCPSCGTESTGLKYCNRCGANLVSISAPTEIVQVNLTKPALIIGVIVAVLTLGGFAMLVIGAGMLATVTRATDPLIALIFMGIVTILTADILLIRQLSKIVTAALKPDQTGRSNNKSRPNPRRSSHGQTPHLFFLRPASPKTRPAFWKVTIAPLSKPSLARSKTPNYRERLRAPIVIDRVRRVLGLNSGT